MPERLFADIERRFEAEQRASRLGRRFQAWRTEHPPLRPFEDPDTLVSFFRDRAIPYLRKNEITWILCGLSADDELAELLLLKLFVPGLIARRSRLFGYGLTQDELDVELVTGLRTRAAKSDLGTERLIGKLLEAAEGRAKREIEQRAKLWAREAPTADDEVFESAGEVADPAEEALGGNKVAELIQEAQAEGALDEEDAEILRLIHVDGLTNTEAADRIEVSPGTAGVRLHRARRRLGRWLMERDALAAEGDSGGV